MPRRPVPGQLVAALEERLHVRRVEGFTCGHVEIGRDVRDVAVDAVALAVKVEPVKFLSIHFPCGDGHFSFTGSNKT